MKAVLLAALLVLSSALNPIAVKVATQHLSPIGLLEARLILATLFFFVVRRALPLNEPPIRRNDLFKMAGAGILAFVINFTLYFYGVKASLASHGSIVFALYPLVTCLLARIFLNHLVRWSQYLGIILSFVGIAIINLEDGLSLNVDRLIGDLMIFGGVICYSFFVILSEGLTKKFEAITLAAYGFLTATVVLFFPGLPSILAFSWEKAGLPFWLSFLHLATLGSLGTYVAFFLLLKYLKIVKVAALYYYIPITTVLLAHLLIKEKIGGTFALGTVLTLIGLAIFHWVRPRPKPA